MLRTFTNDVLPVPGGPCSSRPSLWEYPAMAYLPVLWRKWSTCCKQEALENSVLLLYVHFMQHNFGCSILMLWISCIIASTQVEQAAVPVQQVAHQPQQCIFLRVPEAVECLLVAELVPADVATLVATKLRRRPSSGGSTCSVCGRQSLCRTQNKNASDTMDRRRQPAAAAHALLVAHAVLVAVVAAAAVAIGGRIKVTHLLALLLQRSLPGT